MRAACLVVADGWGSRGLPLSCSSAGTASQTQHCSDTDIFVACRLPSLPPPQSRAGGRAGWCCSQPGPSGAGRLVPRRQPWRAGCTRCGGSLASAGTGGRPGLAACGGPAAQSHHGGMQRGGGGAAAAWGRGGRGGSRRRQGGSAARREIQRGGRQPWRRWAARGAAAAAGRWAAGAAAAGCICLAPQRQGGRGTRAPRPLLHHVKKKFHFNVSSSFLAQRFLVLASFMPLLL